MKDAQQPYRAYYTRADCDPAAFAALIATSLDGAAVPLACDVAKNIPVYDAAALDLTDPVARHAVLSEWAWVLGPGPGVLVIRNAQLDHAAIEAASDVFAQIIADEKGGAGGGADHFAAAGANDRVWNSLQKLALRAPEVFARYHAMPAMDAVCEAWLGPAYQVTAQVNLVRPGGKAQTGHRDYHLGFMTEEQAFAIPAHAHHLSPALTLQGGLAHVDMGVEAGPTKLLPWSHQFGPGYLAYRQPAFADMFEAQYVQLPLSKGDAVFFNPALFHAGGENRSTDTQRLVNLFQVSSAMGRAMEAVDRDAMCRALLPFLREMAPGPGRDAVVAASAEGYPFPTSMDNDPPVDGLAPASQADLLRAALDTGQSDAEFCAALVALKGRQCP